MSKIKSRNLKLASKFDYKISKLFSTYPVPERYYFICHVNIGKYCTVNAFWKTQFLMVAHIFCSQTDYFSPSQIQRIWILELWSVLFRGEWIGSSPCLFISQCLNLCWEQEKMSEIPMVFPKSHTTLLFLACTQPPWISLASILPSLTQIHLMASPQPPLLPGVSQYPYIPLLSLPSTATTPNLLLEGPWHLHCWHILWGALPKPVHLCQPNSWSCAGSLPVTLHIFPLLSKALECVHCIFISGPNGAGFSIHLGFPVFVGNLWVRYLLPNSLWSCSLDFLFTQGP